MSRITVDFNNKLGRIKPVHGVGRPNSLGTDFNDFHYLKEANIPYSRLHDVGYPYGEFRFVDIPNIFRDFDADPADPAAYDFTFTDMMITALMENGVEPVYRLGVSIENDGYIKAYRTYPPKDYLKWAKICEGVIRHYTEGWADGFNYDIRYWEIWNEPDNFEEVERNSMWKATKEDFFEFYDVAAKHLKSNFPHLKIGGYGSCGFYSIYGTCIFEANSSPRFDYFITFFDAFLAYIKAHNTPFDFFSWHSYSTVEENKGYAEYARKRLDEEGFTETETSCNEWNCRPTDRGKASHTAENTAILIAFQDSPLDTAMFYDAALTVYPYGGLFSPLDRKPFPLYYGFKAFGELYVAGTQVKAECDNDKIYVSAAVGDNGGRVLISNLGEEAKLSLDLGREITCCRIIDETCVYEECDLPDTIGENTVIYIETR